MTQDDDQLQILSIFYFVVAGMAALASMFPTVHLFVGVCMVSGFFTDPREPFPFALIGWFFIIIASCLIVFGLVFASLMVLAGRYLRQRRKYQFCLGMAGVACAFMPFGTVLGVFTILMLMKENVKAQFQHAPVLEPKRKSRGGI